MNEEIKIIDKSGDKECFTIVPNYILNHSTSGEQALYLQMKRLAGEEGKCFATLETLSKKLGCGEHKVRLDLKKLLKRNWIKKVGTVKGKTRPINAYEIVNIWALNNKFYKEKIKVQGTISSKKTKDRGSGDDKIGAERTLEEEHSVTKKDISKDISVSKADKEKFSYKTYLEDLIGNKRRDIHIIGLYWQYKGFAFDNKLQCSAAIKRELRPVKNLIGYLDDRILEVMEWLENNTDMKWTLETIHKFIDEDLDNIEPFNNKNNNH